jgi:cell division protein FtsI (penicillin-binding protein 3)
MTNKARKWLKFRLATVLIFFMILFVALVSRAFQLQILSGEALKAKADRQQTISVKLQTERGQILDRNGKVLAASLQADSVYADPSMIKDREVAAARLSKILGVNKRSIRKKLHKYERFCWIARKISPDQARRIRKLNMDGVVLIKEPKRFYTNKGLAGHLLGFVGVDSDGLSGLELKYNASLKNVFQRISWGKDARGQRLCVEESVTNRDTEGSYSLILTIDSRIQHIVEVQLAKAREETGAKRGIVVVMDPKTGEILAMACEPGFNPTVFNKYSGAMRKNRVITDCFDPGSIFKPFVIAAALDEGVIEETELFNCENGRYVVGRRIIREAHGKKYEDLTARDILKYSSNIGSAKIAAQLGKERLYAAAGKFGFGSKTAIDLPGEATGIIRTPETWTEVDLATIGFGQGISVTAIQMITAMSAIANQGVLMQPHVVRGIVDKKGQVVSEFVPTEVRRAIAPLTAQMVTSYLTDVVEAEDGTGKNARISNTAVAGKTGTAQKFDFEKGRYSSQKVTASFVGFLPANDPQMAILVVLDEPEVKRWGGQAAAPVFRSISEQVLRCFDRHVGDQELVADDWTMEIENASILDIPVDGRGQDESVMPDFTGMTMREVFEMARERDIHLQLRGSGWAVSQKPLPGTLLARRNSCEVVFRSGY